MKSKFQTLKNILFVGMATLTGISISHSQVITRVLSPDDKIENYIPWYNADEEIPIVNAPFVDVEAVLQEDQQTGREMPRLGIKQELNYTEEDGQLKEKANYSLWSMTLRSANAKSMSVRFENTILPENAVMFLFNEESRFIVGPIKNSKFRDGTFQSDYVNGDHIGIYVFLPSSKPNDSFSIDIPLYYHGIITLMDEMYDSDFGTSAPCNVNVACEQGVGWECQISSVCKIIIGEGSCSGALINNDCCDLTPYLLTANHCFTTSQIDPIDWNFRFHYDSPLCDPSEEPHPSQWVTYSGAIMSARWGGTDFYLLELIQDIRPEDRISFAGWDRSEYIGNNTTIIHHPSGDVKKITYDNEPAEVENDETLNYPPNLVAGRYVRIELSNGSNGDYGIAEGGTSGAPYFNDNNRIFAQHRGGPNLTCTNTNNRWAGRINASWEGNGTQNPRLRDWLGASTNPTTMDCMEHPFIEGPDLFCDEPEVFTLLNNMPCVENVNWSVEPSNLFSSPTIGVGETATLASNDNASGAATIRFILSSEGCDNAEIEHSFWVGQPQVTTNIQYPVICINQFEEMVIPESPGATDYQLQSLSPNIWLSTNNPTPNVPFPIIGNQLGYHQLLLTVSNACGSSSSVIYVEVVRCNGDGGGFEFRSSYLKSSETDLDVNIFPNPANEFIEIVCSDYIPGTRIEASFISTNGKVIRTMEEYSHHFKVNVADLPSGFYVLQLNVNGTIFHKKILKL